MSLFPAYSDISENSKASASQDKEWLTNSSFAVSFPIHSQVSQDVGSSDSLKKEKKTEEKLPESEPKEHLHKSVKKKKKKKKSSLEKPAEQEIISFENDLFFIDKAMARRLLRRKTAPSLLRPKYDLKFKQILHGPIEKKKNKKIKRYFKAKPSKFKKISDDDYEEEIRVLAKKEEFRKHLRDDPHDILTWFDFVNFQDEFYNGQHISFQTTVERERTIAHQKLTILDRAVTENPQDKDLQAMWLKIGASVLPSEEMSRRIDNILKASGGTMTLWLGLMTTTQHSLARCTMPSVTRLYEELLLNFQKEKRKEVHTRDLNVLELLFHYGRFLDNCGHWETLWLMIKVNLQFNTKVKLDIELNVDEKVKQLENNVLEKEKQAIWQMWSQLERIREGLHFLPDVNSIDYPQRCVSSDTVVNFTWHFHPDLHFQLVVSFIVLLKVPLLPSTDTILRLLAPNALPWAFDSPEFILSAVMTSPAVSLQYNYLSPLTQLSRGPQYLRRLQGQTEFLQLISNTFEACWKCFEGIQKTGLGVWWLRFERWIQHLSKLQLASLPENRKSAKSFFKDFLKIEENRSNLLYYLEYSLLEFNLGNVEASIKTLKTIISSQSPVLNMSKEEQGPATALYRSLCEILVGTDRKNQARDLLINLGSGNPIDSKVTIHMLSASERNFEQISQEIIQDPELENGFSLEDLLMPSFIIEWISCYFWLIALVKEPNQLKKCYESILDALKDKTGILLNHIRESLSETIITISWVIKDRNLMYIKDLLKQNFVLYPKNLKILAFMSDVTIQNNEYWWAVKKNFHSPSTYLNYIFLVCLALDRFEKDKENFLNRVRNLFQNLTLGDGKLSSMIHCLRLRYLYLNDNSHLENAQLQALESCPWSKCIYMESILLLPAKLMQLTDVLIEKELRIHITPDEIQEMRD